MPSFDAVLREYQAQIWKMASAVTRSRGIMPLLQDLVAVGSMALWMAHGQYDHSRGTTLWQYAYSRVRGAMLDELRRQDHLSRRCRQEMKSSGKTALELVPWGALQQVPEEHAEHVPASDENPEDNAIRVERFEVVGRLLDRLDSRDRQMLESYLFHRISMSVIGKEYGLSESRICQLIHGAHNRLKELMLEEGIMNNDEFQEEIRTEENNSSTPPGQGQTLTHDGLTLTVREWAKKTGFSLSLLYGRIKRGWTPDKILTVPPRKRDRHVSVENPSHPRSEIAVEKPLVAVPAQDKIQEISDPAEVLSIRQKCWRLDQIDSQIGVLVAERLEIMSHLKES